MHVSNRNGAARATWRPHGNRSEVAQGPFWRNSSPGLNWIGRERRKFDRLRTKFGQCRPMLDQILSRSGPKRQKSAQCRPISGRDWAKSALSRSKPDKVWSSPANFGHYWPHSGWTLSNRCRFDGCLVKFGRVRPKLPKVCPSFAWTRPTSTMFGRISAECGREAEQFGSMRAAFVPECLLRSIA